MKRFITFLVALSFLLAACSQAAAPTPTPLATTAPAATPLPVSEVTPMAQAQPTATQAQPTAETTATVGIPRRDEQLAVIKNSDKLSMTTVEKTFPTLDASSAETLQAGAQAWVTAIDALNEAPTPPKAANLKWLYRDGKIWDTGDVTFIKVSLAWDHLKDFSKPAFVGLLKHGPNVVASDASSQLLLFPEKVNDQWIIVVVRADTVSTHDKKGFDTMHYLGKALESDNLVWAAPFINVRETGGNASLAIVQKTMRALRDAGIIDLAANEAFAEAIKKGRPAPQTDKVLFFAGCLSSDFATTGVYQIFAKRGNMKKVGGRKK
jgi:hypothetical protein